MDDGVIDESTGSGIQVQGIVGIDFKVTPGLQLFVEGRARNITSNVEDTAGNSSDINIGTTSLQGGLRFLF